MGCCQTKSGKGVGNKYKLEGVDDELPETEKEEPTKKKELTPENLLIAASLGGDFGAVQNLLNQVNLEGGLETLTCESSRKQRTHADSGDIGSVRQFKGGEGLHCSAQRDKEWSHGTARAISL